jgi:AbrB family looped-hinge helix DNA binding protein
MKATISEKGQITIPKPIRDRLGLRPGTTMRFKATNGKLIGEKADPEVDPVLSVTGIIKKLPDVDAYIASIRGPAK